MRTTVKLPKLGDATDEVLVLSIEAAVGSEVALGDALLHVETDKVEADVPAPVAGRVVEVLVAVGDEVGVGAGVVVLET